jgi:hypothetical protein
MHLFTIGVISNNQLVYEYPNSSGKWSTLPVVDGTNAGTGPLTQSGAISFTPPTDWVATTINKQMRMWIRLRITASGVVYSAVPTGDYCSLPPGFGYVYLYCNDGSGDLSATLKTAVEAVVELYRGCGIIVKVVAPNKLIYPIKVQIVLQANYDPTYISNKVQQAIIDHLNAKVLGEDLYLAELYQLIMDVDDVAIVNATISEPVFDIIVPSSGVLRADSSKISVTYLQESS